jgi:hypothetical protein
MADERSAQDPDAVWLLLDAVEADIESNTSITVPVEEDINPLPIKSTSLTKSVKSMKEVPQKGVTGKNLLKASQ